MHRERLNGVEIDVADPGDVPVKRPSLPLGQLDIRIAAKGGLSIYGLQRFPVTLYVEAWEAILAGADQIQKAIAMAGDSLKRKS